MASFKYVERGAGRYVAGQIEAFDQKNEMFCRPFWDPAMLDLGKKFYMTEVPPKDKPGYRLHDQALVNAAWLGGFKPKFDSEHPDTESH